MYLLTYNLPSSGLGEEASLEPGAQHRLSQEAGVWNGTVPSSPALQTSLSCLRRPGFPALADPGWPGWACCLKRRGVCQVQSLLPKLGVGTKKKHKSYLEICPDQKPQADLETESLLLQGVGE